MTEDRSTLAVLEALSESPDTPQRRLAERTGLNLAKVNFVLRRLTERGLVQLRRVRTDPHTLRTRYLLTPEGLAERSRLAYRSVQRTLQQYGAIERRAADAIESMLAAGARRVLLWGDGEVTELCLRLLRRRDGQVALLGVVDESGRHPLAVHPSRLEALEPDAVLLCVPEVGGLPPGLDVWRIL